MIDFLRLRNFKGIRRADLGLERLTVIVGPNASGKTSFLEALLHLTRFGYSDPKKYFQGRRDPLLLYRRGVPGEEMELYCSGSMGTRSLHVSPPVTFYSDWLHPELLEYEWGFRVEGGELDGGRGIDAQLMRFDLARLVAPSSTGSMVLGRSGQGLASVLASLALNQPDVFGQIQERLRKIVPTVERIRFERETIPTQDSKNGGGLSPLEEFDDDLYYHSKVKESLIFDLKGTPGIPAYLASEGTLLALALLVVLMGRYRHDLVLLDDIDRGLHPKAQREVVRLLHAVLDQDPDLQIVATSHSPYLVDCLRPEEVRLTSLGDDGSVSIASLVEHPDFDQWKDEMAPGEMWSLFGEKWVGELPKNSVEK